MAAKIAVAGRSDGSSTREEAKRLVLLVFGFLANRRRLRGSPDAVLEIRLAPDRRSLLARVAAIGESRHDSSRVAPFAQRIARLLLGRAKRHRRQS